MQMNQRALAATSIALLCLPIALHAAPCSIASPVLPCQINSTIYDTFAGNYSESRAFYKASSYNTQISDGYLGLTLKDGLPHTDGYMYVTGYYTPTVWTSPEPYNADFRVFGQFNGGGVKLADHFEWIGAGAAASQNYGLFIGSRDPGSQEQPELRADIMATRVADAFSARPASRAFTLTGDLTPNQNGDHSNPVRLSDIASKFTEIRSSMKPGDTFTLYMAGHGGVLDTDKNSGDEAVRTGDFVTDNWLASELGKFDGFRKMTFIDACRSGGFWGSGDLTETLGVADLDQLSNIALFAASGEYTSTYFDGSTGLLFYGLALEEALRDPGESLSAKDLSIRLVHRSKALASWPHYPDPYFYEADFGDPVLVDTNLLNASFVAAADFDIDAPIFAVPEVRSQILLVLGLLALYGRFAWRRCVNDA